MVYQGEMVLLGTWPKALLVRNDGPGTWTVLGRPGEEKESMAVSLYNRKLYLGTLPLAQVYRYDGITKLTLVGRLDHTPDVVYRCAGLWPSTAAGPTVAYCLRDTFSVSKPERASRTTEPWTGLAAHRRGERWRLAPPLC